ncbi:MAG: dockerin type I domain-containing protein, partial [bacterium]
FGTIATIEFKGTSGTSAISFEISTNPEIEKTNLINNNGVPIPFNFINGSVSVTIPGDADGSGQVNLLDFYILRSEFGQSGPNLASDFNHDGTVDLLDFYILRQNFGQTRVRSQESNDNVLLSIEPGKEAFNVKIANVSSLIATTLDLSFDSNVIDVLSIEKGEFLSNASILEEKTSQGRVKYTLALLSGEKQGTGTLAVIKFKEKKEGKTEVVFGTETKLMDSFGNWIEYKAQLGEINIPGSNSGKVKIEPIDSMIFIGETKTIGVSIEAQDLLGANLELSYDKLEVLGITKGNFGDVFLFSTQTNKITLIGAKLGSPSSGLITLANITFKAIQEGTVSLSFSLVDLRDKNNTKIASEALGGTITIRKYLIGDLNKDGEITFDDLMEITTNWKKNKKEYDIGPADGIPPNLISNPDGIIDFEDLMVFCLMWNYKNLKTKTQNSKLPVVWIEKENNEFVIKYDGFSDCMGANINLFFEGELSIKTNIPTFLSHQEGGRLNLAIFLFHSLPPSGIIARIKATGLRIESADLRDYENKKMPVEIKGIKAESLKDSYCYPNPTRVGWVKFENLPPNTKLSLYNIAGELVFFKENLTSGAIPLNIAPGVYIYILQDGKEKKIGKLGVIK